MCLQDYQLIRGLHRREHTYTTTGVGVGVTLPKDESRVLITYLGPSAGIIEIYRDSILGATFLGSFAINTIVTQRNLSIFDIGPLIQDNLIFRASAAQTATIIEYQLPLDPENLKRLADKGKW